VSDEYVAHEVLKIIEDALHAAGIRGVKVKGNTIEFPLATLASRCRSVMIKVEAPT
jgi:hypothetical protein